MSNKQTREFVQRIEALESEQATLASDKRDLYTEAEAAGFVVKALRALIRKRKRDRDEVQEIDSLVAQYELDL